jgi:uncharacterized membrane-anchored protein YjiN (DUF445 family)
MKTVFIRAIEADVEDKDTVLRKAIVALAADCGERFEVDPSAFRVIPKCACLPPPSQ